MECIVAEVGCASVHVAEPPALSKSKAARVERPALFVRECRLLIPPWPPLRLSIPRTCGRALEVVPVMNREMKALRAGSMAAASCPANISVAGATVDLPPDQWKLLADDKHPFTARLFDFVACVIVRRFLEKEVQEHIRVVTSDVVADIVADRDEAVKAFAGVMECSLVAFCIWTEDLVDNNCSNASMLLMLHPDHLSIDGDENWHTRFVRVAIPPGGREHVTAAEAIVEWFQGRVDEEFARGSIQCTRARQLQDPNRLYDMDATSLKGSCGNLACLFALDKTLAQLDAVAANGSGPQFSRPTAKTLNALRHDAHQTAEELAFNLSVDFPRHKHGGEAEGAELGKMHEVTTGARVADHGVLALTGAAGVSSRGGARGGTAVHADDDGADDTATKGAPREDADRTVAREGEESSEEEAEAHVVAAAAANRPATSGKSIKHLAQHLAPGAGSAAPSGEVAGKSPMTCARDHASLSALPSHRLAAEILQLDCRLAAQAEEIARLKIRQESGVGGVAVVGSEELAAALSNAVRLLEREARALAQERAALLDTHNQEALVLGRVDARLGQLQGVVADSMETAQKKLTDEVARKIDNMSSAVSATAERAITTSGVTNTLHTLIALVGGSPTPRTGTEDPATTENADAGDAEHGKRAAGAKAETQRGAKRQRVPQAAAAVRHPSVHDILKNKWGTASRGAAPPGQPGSSSRSIPPGEAAPKAPGPAGATATVTTTAGKGKGKLEDGEVPAAVGSLAAGREEQSAAAAAAEGRQTALAPAHPAITAGHLHSALASAGPSAAAGEAKTEKRGRGKKLPPPPVYTIDEDDADEELENLASRWVGEEGDGGEQGVVDAVELFSGGESADEQDADTVVVPSGPTGGQGDTVSKRKGCGIRHPPRGGPGLVSEPHLGGKKRWLGQGERDDLQYKTAIAMMPYDLKVDPGLHLSSKQMRDWAADLSAAEGLHTGLLITMHHRNLVASRERWTRMFKHYRELTQPGSTTTNEIAWAAVVGTEAAAEETELYRDVDPRDYAGAIACAIAMVWEVTRGSAVSTASDSGNLAARAVNCQRDRCRLFPVVTAYVIRAVRRRNSREKQAGDDEPKVVADPRVVADAIASEVVNDVVAKSRDLRHIEMAARETVDVIITWCDCSVAGKVMESIGLYLALPKDRLKKRT
ncbi:unnamed protein product [Closterium sp. Yama58-4]|nr:unnamed protein product [Closterium sp. Yama58-4]